MTNIGRLRPFIAALALTVFVSPALAQPTDETLLTPLPKGFKLGYSASNARETLTEYVPQAETVEDWSRMVTVQVFHALHGADPDAFVGKLEAGWKSSCPGGSARKIKTGTENGFPFSVWAFNCPLNPQTQKPETMFIKATSGADGLYSVQYAYRTVGTKDMMIAALAYLVGVGVCDPRRPDRPCPSGM